MNLRSLIQPSETLPIETNVYLKAYISADLTLNVIDTVGVIGSKAHIYVYVLGQWLNPRTLGNPRTGKYFYKDLC